MLRLMDYKYYFFNERGIVTNLTFKSALKRGLRPAVVTDPEEKKKSDLGKKINDLKKKKRKIESKRYSRTRNDIPYFTGDDE
jgi:hypothetical protein